MSLVVAVVAAAIAGLGAAVVTAYVSVGCSWIGWPHASEGVGGALDRV